MSDQIRTDDPPDADDASAHAPSSDKLHQRLPEANAWPSPGDQAGPSVRQLDEELQQLREQLRMTIEQHEASAEELRASNEALETSKEELQSVNEELTTVNQELKNKVDEISRANSHLQNLIVSTQIGTIFLDRELRIKFYTPQVQGLFNLIASDTNRPLAHVTHQLDYPKLLDDALRTLNQHVAVERELQHLDGSWYLARLLPYRTIDNVVDGVVLTFIDITRRKYAEESLRASEQRLREVLRHLPVGMMIAEANGELSFGNQQLEEIVGQPFEPGRGNEVYRDWQLVDPASGQPLSIEKQPLARALRSGEAVRGEELLVRRSDSTERRVIVNAGPMFDQRSSIVLAVAAFIDITERRQAEQVLAESEQALRAAYTDMEHHVEARTVELAEINVSLQDEITQRRRAEHAGRALLHQLVSAQEEERRRISRELHDQMGQQLMVLSLGLEALKSSSYGRSDALGKIEQLRAIVDTIGQEVHQLALGLRPAALDDLGLGPALVNHIEDWSRRTGIEAALHIGTLDTTRLPPELEITIYRVVLEALTNVARHARARHVSVLLERRDHTAIVIVEDNGRGFDVESVMQNGDVSTRLGIMGMQERVEQLGGTLMIESSAGSGTTVYIQIPLAR